MRHLDGQPENQSDDRPPQPLPLVVHLVIQALLLGGGVVFQSGFGGISRFGDRRGDCQGIGLAGIESHVGS